MPSARKSKWFRVAVEGATTDGRKIERTWLSQIAKSYNPEKYGARIFIEHIRGLNPEWGFRCMGDVLALKTEEVEIDGAKKLALFAQIQPTDEMLALNKAGQKVFTSIEVDPDFTGSGEAYLVGLGITDSPASLGTEILQFAAQNPAASPFTARKQKPENLFTAAEETTIEFEEEIEPGPSLLERVRQLFRAKGNSDDARFSDVHGAVEQVAQELTSTVAAFNAQLTAMNQTLSAMKASSEKAIADLASKIDHTPAPTPTRPPASGGGNTVLTDC